MKRLLIVLSVIIAVVLAGCQKTADEVIPSSQTNIEMKKSETPVPFNGYYEGFIVTAEEGGPCDEASGWMSRSLVAEGNANHIGNSDMEMNYCSRFSYPTPEEPFDGIFEGPATLTAANGEVLQGYMTGTFTFVWENGVLTKGLISADGILYSGTGNYEGVTAYMHGVGEMDLLENGFAGPMPVTLTFTGYLQYAGEMLDGEVEGEQDMVAPIAGCTGNSWNFVGGGPVAPMGTVINTNDYCSQTIFGPWPYPGGGTIAYGGTNEGVGTLQDEDGDVINSTFTGQYSFFYQIPTNVTNFFVGEGIITGGTGKYEGATGRFVMTGIQDVTSLIIGGNTQNIPSSFKFIGYVIY